MPLFQRSGLTEPQSGTLGAALPVADAAGVTTDSDTYDNVVTGSGKLNVLVVPAAPENATFAVAVEGDAFPRWLWIADDGLYLGDGTSDPYNNSAIEFDRPDGVHAGIGVSGDLLVTDVYHGFGRGPIIKSPNEHRWRITVGDDGTLDATDLDA